MSWAGWVNAQSPYSGSLLSVCAPHLPTRSLPRESSSVPIYFILNCPMHVDSSFPFPKLWSPTPWRRCRLYKHSIFKAEGIPPASHPSTSGDHGLVALPPNCNPGSYPFLPCSSELSRFIQFILRPVPFCLVSLTS